MRHWMTRASICDTMMSPTCCGGIRHVDVIILDVDNGADAPTTAGNARLYSGAGIGMAKAALRPNGCLAYWSASDDRKFERMLRGAGFAVEVVKVRAHSTSGGWDTLFIARNPTSIGQTLME